MGTRPTITVTALSLLSSSTTSCGRAAEKVPILYSTDLHHPHMDPDDDFDLATLFPIREFDIRSIVLDQTDDALDFAACVRFRHTPSQFDFTARGGVDDRGRKQQVAKCIRWHRPHAVGGSCVGAERISPWAPARGGIHLEH